MNWAPSGQDSAKKADGATSTHFCIQYTELNAFHSVMWQKFIGKKADGAPSTHFCIQDTELNAFHSVMWQKFIGKKADGATSTHFCIQDTELNACDIAKTGNVASSLNVSLSNVVKWVPKILSCVYLTPFDNYYYFWIGVDCWGCLIEVFGQ